MKDIFLPSIKERFPPPEATNPVASADPAIPPDATKDEDKKETDTPIPASWSTDLELALHSLLYNTSDYLHTSYPSLMTNYPAHLHIDLLPEYQQKGLGTELMTRFLEEIKEKGATGVHLLMVEGNLDKAGVFYEKVGFKRFEEVVDGGISGETGRGDGTIWFVRDV